MRAAAEIKKVFKNNFKRDIEIFKCWVLGHSLESISNEVGISKRYVKDVILKKAERSLCYSNGLTWDQMPGFGAYSHLDYQNHEHKGFYLNIISKSLSIDFENLGGDV